MSDFACLKIGPEGYVCGLGDFASSALPPQSPDDVAFYINDFQLGDPAPWKRPQRWLLAEDAPRALNGSAASVGGFPAIEWSGLGGAEFRQIYEEIQQSITDGRLEKSVPVLAERGRVTAGDPAAMVHALGGLPEATWGYGWQLGHSGIVGATPERLFSLDGPLLATMALAGTSPRHETEAFLTDPKEIREHEYVVDYLLGKLSALGTVERSPRFVMDLGSIVHFASRIQVELRLPAPGIDELMRLLHPTPALGAYPRGDGALRQLLDYRRRLGAPAFFGAPFGVWWDGRFHSVVMIRNVSWEGREVWLPSGCGIIRESRFDREWRELALKRNSVKALLGV